MFIYWCRLWTIEKSPKFRKGKQASELLTFDVQVRAEMADHSHVSCVAAAEHQPLFSVDDVLLHEFVQEFLDLDVLYFVEFLPLVAQLGK